jgi:hemerythrin-like domain-containing protein
MLDWHPFLLNLFNEHLEIVRRLGELHQGAQTHDPWGALKEFFAYCENEIQKQHNLKEELVLFPAMSSKAAIQAGGPLCMLYFDLHMANHPLDRSAAACGKKRTQPGPTNVPAHLRTFFEENTPVCIPTTDHLAAAELTLRANEILSGEQNENALRELKFLADVYVDLMKGHFEKENNCLLPMCHSILSVDDLNECARRWADGVQEQPIELPQFKQR